MEDYPLHGLKVLDFSRVLAGPFAGRMLSDLGADVVKIEPPDGDVTRLWGRNVGNVPGYYSQQNAGKRNICVDLRADGARELVLKLAGHADVVIENYRPDVMPRLGLGYDDLKAVNDDIIMLSISGFGQGGPESHRPAYAPIVHAEAGLMYRQTDRSGSPHQDLPLSVADTNAALHGLVGLLSAVIMRGRTGRGQHIDMAMIDATLATDDQLQYALEDSEETGPLANDTWESGAGPVLLSADFRFLWKMLVEHFDIADLTAADMSQDARIAARREAVRAFMAELRDLDAVEAAMARMNIAWGPVRDPALMREQATVRHRGSIIDIDDRVGGTRPITQSPYRFSNASSGVRGPAPHRGEHNMAVLAEWLALAPAAVEDLKQAGVLLADEDAGADGGSG